MAVDGDRAAGYLSFLGDFVLPDPLQQASTGLCHMRGTIAAAESANPFAAVNEC